MTIFLLLLCLVSPAQAASAVKTAVDSIPGGEQVTVTFDAAVTPIKHFRLDAPPRLVVDIPALRSGKGIARPAGYNGHLIKAVRYGRPQPDVSRMVIDLAGAVANYTVMTGNNPPRVVVSLQAAGKGTAAPTPQNKPQAEATQARKPLIVVDPGHGGKDSGAIGASGVFEKEITLRYAQALAQALEDSGRYRAVLTRTDDRYLFLGERVEVARKHRADMFISLHADSNPNPRAVGFSVYTLSEEASDAETAALAEQENRADIIGGVNLAVEDKQVASILLDLAQRETRNKGSQFAELMIDRMHPKVPLLTNTHRFAGFKVLKAPDIPSVLVELGFLSNREDEARLKSREYQDKVTRSLVAAIDAYWKGRE